MQNITASGDQIAPTISTGHRLSERDRLITETMPLVKSIADRLKRSLRLWAPFEDLCAFGMAGLVEAADRFDPRRGVAFGTFAHYRIRGAIIDALRRNDGRFHTIASRRDLTAASGTNAYLAACLEAEPPQVDGASDDPSAVLEKLSSLLSGVATVHIASLDALGALEDPDAPQPDEEADKAALSGRLRRAIEALPERERQVIELHYYADESFEKIGAKLDICKPWACRLHARAVRLLRDQLGADSADDR